MPWVAAARPPELEPVEIEIDHRCGVQGEQLAEQQAADEGRDEQPHIVADRDRAAAASRDAGERHGVELLRRVRAGWAETENQVPAIAQLITLPQFFFSGVFFSKEAAPEVIRPITNALPLTFLNDALREISVQGASIWDVRMQILGLLVWTVVGFFLAVRFFRFDRF